MIFEISSNIPYKLFYINQSKSRHWTAGQLRGKYLNEPDSRQYMDLIVFQDKNIRRVRHNEEWWFVAVDIIGVLTDSADPKGYLKDMRRRDESFAQGWGQIATPLSIQTPGGKQNINCVSTKGALRLVQSIPSKRAEPFKQWLARVGYERIEEINNPELAQNRAKKYYELKGYPKEWIDKRIRGIAIRQNLTEEWKNREVKEGKEFAILTNEISKATFNKDVNEYKKLKGLDNHNLRDHMDDWELILTMVGEKATTDLTISKDNQGFHECKETAKEGGNIAGNTRKELERKLGKTLVSDKNHPKKKLK
jgi:DNA-damage-inducible protein D